LPEGGTLANIDQLIQLAQQQLLIQQKQQQTPPPAPVFFTLQTTGTPYLPEECFAAPGIYISPLYGFRPGGVDSEGNPQFGSATLQAGLAVNGEGRHQTSTFFVMVGEFTSQSPDGTNQVHTGQFTATTRLAANKRMGRASGNADSVPDSEVLNSDNIPTEVTLNQNRRDPITGGVTPDTAFSFSGVGGPPTNYTYSNAFTQAPVPPGVGQERTGEQLTGFVGGVMQTRHAASPSSGSWPVGRSFPVVGGLVIDFQKQGSRFQAVANIAKVANFNGDAHEFSSAVLQVGNLNAAARNTGTYIDDNLFGGLAAVNEAPGVATVTQVSTTKSTSQLNETPLTRSQQAFATSKLVNGEGVILAHDPGATLCVCEYTRWGAWSVDNARANPYGSEERDQAHMMMWVAGRKSSSVDIPTVGGATYNGYMTGAFKNGSSKEYLAGSNFSYTANFGNPAASSMSVADLDGVTYAGNLAFVRATNTIAGSITGTNVYPKGPLWGSATMNLDGAFFKGKTDPIKDVAGRFFVTGNPTYYPAGNFRYIGAGIFAGSRP
jgi:hypothetical protein